MLLRISLNIQISFLRNQDNLLSLALLFSFGTLLNQMLEQISLITTFKISIIVSVSEFSFEFILKFLSIS